MNDEMKFAGIGAYLYGALYLTGTFVLGVATGNHIAAVWAVVAAGAAYVAQIVSAFQISGWISTRVSMAVWLIALVPAVVAGLSLVFGG